METPLVSHPETPDPKASPRVPRLPIRLEGLTRLDEGALLSAQGAGIPFPTKTIITCTGWDEPPCWCRQNA